MESGVQQDHIIEIEFDRRENKEYRNPDVALKYIKNQIRDDEKYYIFLDEVHVYPLCFREFMEVFDGDRYQGLAEYMNYG